MKSPTKSITSFRKPSLISQNELENSLEFQSSQSEVSWKNDESSPQQRKDKNKTDNKCSNDFNHTPVRIMKRQVIPLVKYNKQQEEQKSQLDENINPDDYLEASFSQDFEEIASSEKPSLTKITTENNPVKSNKTFDIWEGDEILSEVPLEMLTQNINNKNADIKNLRNLTKHRTNSSISSNFSIKKSDSYDKFENKYQHKDPITSPIKTDSRNEKGNLMTTNSLKENSSQRICSREEIEAKRQVALKRLRATRKRKNIKERNFEAK